VEVASTFIIVTFENYLFKRRGCCDNMIDVILCVMRAGLLHWTVVAWKEVVFQA